VERPEPLIVCNSEVVAQGNRSRGRRATFDVVVDGERVGSVEMNKTIEVPIEPGRHTLQVRDGRKSSGAREFEVTQGEVIAYRCTGKRFLPIFLASCVAPSLALALVRE
jgi:hypothetical protein